MKAKDVLKLWESVNGIQEASALRPLASSSDREKYAGLKKQIDDLLKQKAAINTQWENEKDDDKRADLYQKKHSFTDKIEPLEKQRKALLSKFRGIQKRN